MLAPVWSAEDAPAIDPVDRFKKLTLRKLEGLTCLAHGLPPTVDFHGTSLRDVRISMRCCCRDLSLLANRAISRPITAED